MQMKNALLHRKYWNDRENSKREREEIANKKEKMQYEEVMKKANKTWILLETHLHLQ